MTPLQIEILLHYYTRTDDYREGDFSAPAVCEAINDFRDRPDGPLISQEQVICRHACYALTERGKVFVEAILSLPLPVQEWVMPERWINVGGQII